LLFIIDSGVEILNFKKIFQHKISQSAFEVKKKNLIFIKKDNKCSNLHGNIILDIMLSEIHNIEIEEIKSFRMLDSNLNSYNQLLYTCLNYILNEYKKGVINLSLGVLSNECNEELFLMVNELIKKQIYIVCAASKVISYPSVLENVISVSDLNMYKNDRTEIKHKIDFVVDIDSYNYPFIPCSATSFSAPFVTAKAAEILQTKKIDNIFQLKEELSKHFMRWE